VVALEERLFEAGAVSLNYAEAGSGAPVVLLHGGSSRWQHLGHLVHELADRSHVYAPDLRGHGRSSHAPGRYRLTDYADDLVAFLDRRTGPADVFGHSLGGQVAIVAAARRPDLFRALAIGDTPLSVSTLRPGLQQGRPMLSVWRDLAASDRARDEIADALREMRVDFEGRSGRAGDLMAKDSPWFAFMAGCLRDLDPTMLDAVIEFDEMHVGYEADRLLPGISCPVLVIQADPAHGGALSDDDVDIARSLLRDVRVAHIDQVGHSLYPWKIAAVLRDFFQR
jgi:pimeloyl-ACP methyl ester carboxylesterase